MGYFDEIAGVVKNIIIKIIEAAINSAGGANNSICTWSELCNWFKKFITDLKKSFQEKMSDIPYAACMFGKLLGNAIAEISCKLYYKEDGKWIEESVKCQIDENEIPPYILVKIVVQESDITKEMEMEMEPVV